MRVCIKKKRAALPLSFVEQNLVSMVSGYLALYTLPLMLQLFFVKLEPFT